MTKRKGCSAALTDKFWGAMGLCRRAKKLAVGHDEVKTVVRSGKATLIILSSDASQRLENEMRNLTSDANIIRTDADMREMNARIGRHSGVFAVTDRGLGDLILSTIKEDSIYGTDK